MPAPAGFGETGKAAFARYLLRGPARAFATNGSGAYGYSSGQFDQEAANKNALENCAKAAKGGMSCAIVSSGVK